MSTWYYLLLNFIDGTIWLLGPCMLITMFFGFEAKTKGRVLKHMLIALAVYELIAAVMWILVGQKSGQVGVLNGIPVLFGIVYWTINIKNSKRIKGFFISLITAEILTIYVVLISTIFEFIYKALPMSSKVMKGAMVIAPFIWDLVLYGFSKLSCRKRREPMAMPLIVLVLFLSILVDSFMGFYDLEEGAYFQNVAPLRIIVSGKLGDSSLTVGVFVLFILMIIFCVLMIIKESEASFFQKKNTIDEYYLEAQKNHYETLMQSNREIRKIKHDMKNHLYVMAELANRKNYEELSQYISDLEQNLEHANVRFQVGNEIADAILSEKHKKASERGIILKVDGSMAGMELSAIDICTIFSNLLDNAIEAVSKIKEQEKKQIELSIKKHNSYLYICEKNPCATKVDVIDNSISSTKKEKGNHGFGIMNIKEAVAKYDGDVNLMVEDTKDGYAFTIEVVVAV